ncbi:MAG: YlxM family DNA-binding protein [Parasporobacterium sp.]|nr:YlxM family DNA-binding protein [Parasporobacterium sp.]
MEGFVRQSLLYDFYGDLLTQHQKEIYEAYVLQNLSLGEIAEESGISRQGVHDLIRRCNVLLDGYENKLKLVERFLTVREKVGQIQKCADLESAQRIAGEILDII